MCSPFSFRSIDSQECEMPGIINRQYLILFVLVLVILAIRISTIAIPSLEWTSWKEIDYLYISQGYVANGFNFFLPESGWPAEPPRTTEMEFPLVPYLAAITYKAFGFNVYTARLLTLVAFLLIMVFVFRLVERETDAMTALLASFVAGVLPLYHPFGKDLFSEPMMIAMSVASIYYFAEFIEFGRRKDWILSLVSISLTFALKLESLYLFLPFSFILFRKHGLALHEYLKPGLLLILSLLLPVVWYTYAYYLEVTGAHLFGIFSGHNKLQTYTMLSQFRWYRLMAGRVFSGIFGGLYGTILFAVGLIVSAATKRGGIFYAYLVSVIVYFCLVAEGNIDAPYRQLCLIPAGSFFVAVGIKYLLQRSSEMWKRITTVDFSNVGTAITLVVGLLLVLPIGLGRLSEIFADDAPRFSQRWEIAKVIREHSHTAAKIIVVGEYTKHVGGYDLSPVLYYYSGRQGWTLTPEQWDLARIAELHARGAELLIIFNSYGTDPVMNQTEVSSAPFAERLKSVYPVLYEGHESIVFDLSRSATEKEISKLWGLDQKGSEFT